MATYGWPFHGPYKITCPYGKKGSAWKCGYHAGLDLVSVAAGGDGLVHPIAEGTVRKTGYSAAYGNFVMVTHPDGYLSLYAHLTFCLVAAGAPVTRDSALGCEGMTGNSAGRHLHLEVHEGAYQYPATIDPAAFIVERMEDDTVTYEQWKEFKDKYEAEKADEAPAPWSEEARTWAEGTGIIAGDGEGNMQYKSSCTREQMVIFMHRLYKLLKGTTK